MHKRNVDTHRRSSMTPHERKYHLHTTKYTHHIASRYLFNGFFYFQRKLLFLLIRTKGHTPEWHAFRFAPFHTQFIGNFYFHLFFFPLSIDKNFQSNIL